MGIAFLALWSDHCAFMYDENYMNAEEYTARDVHFVHHPQSQTVNSTPTRSY